MDEDAARKERRKQRKREKAEKREKRRKKKKDIEREESPSVTFDLNFEHAVNTHSITYNVYKAESDTEDERKKRKKSKRDKKKDESPDEIGMFLKEIGMEEYCTLFEDEEHHTMDALKSLSKKDLKKKIGITSKEHRKLILTQCQSWVKPEQNVESSKEKKKKERKRVEDSKLNGNILGNLKAVEKAPKTEETSRESDSNTDTESGSDSGSESSADSDSESETDTEMKTEKETSPSTKKDSRTTDSDSDSDSDSGSESESESGSDSDSDSDSETDTEMKVKEKKKKKIKKEKKDKEVPSIPSDDKANDPILGASKDSKLFGDILGNLKPMIKSENAPKTEKKKKTSDTDSDSDSDSGSSSSTESSSDSDTETDSDNDSDSESESVEAAKKKGVTEISNATARESKKRKHEAIEETQSKRIKLDANHTINGACTPTPAFNGTATASTISNQRNGSLSNGYHQSASMTSRSNAYGPSSTSNSYGPSSSNAYGPSSTANTVRPTAPSAFTRNFRQHSARNNANLEMARKPIPKKLRNQLLRYGLDGRPQQVNEYGPAMPSSTSNNVPPKPNGVQSYNPPPPPQPQPAANWNSTSKIERHRNKQHVGQPINRKTLRTMQKYGITSVGPQQVDDYGPSMPSSASTSNNAPPKSNGVQSYHPPPPSNQHRGTMNDEHVGQPINRKTLRTMQKYGITSVGPQQVDEYGPSMPSSSTSTSNNATPKSNGVHSYKPPPANWDSNSKMSQHRSNINMNKRHVGQPINKKTRRAMQMYGITSIGPQQVDDYGPSMPSSSTSNNTAPKSNGKPSHKAPPEKLKRNSNSKRNQHQKQHVGQPINRKTLRAMRQYGITSIGPQQVDDYGPSMNVSNGKQNNNGNVQNGGQHPVATQPVSNNHGPSTKHNGQASAKKKKKSRRKHKGVSEAQRKKEKQEKNKPWIEWPMELKDIKRMIEHFNKKKGAFVYPTKFEDVKKLIELHTMKKITIANKPMSKLRMMKKSFIRKAYKERLRKRKEKEKEKKK